MKNQLFQELSFSQILNRNLGYSVLILTPQKLIESVHQLGSAQVKVLRD